MQECVDEIKKKRESKGIKCDGGEDGSWLKWQLQLGEREEEEKKKKGKEKTKKIICPPRGSTKFSLRKWHVRQWFLLLFSIVSLNLHPWNCERIAIHVRKESSLFFFKVHETYSTTWLRAMRSTNWANRANIAIY